MNVGQLKEKIKDMHDDILVVFKCSHNVSDFEILDEAIIGEVEPGTPPGYYFLAEKDRDKSEDEYLEVQKALILT